MLHSDVSKDCPVNQPLYGLLHLSGPYLWSPHTHTQPFHVMAGNATLIKLFAVDQGPCLSDQCIAVNIRFSLTIRYLKKSDGNGFLQLTGTCER